MNASDFGADIFDGEGEPDAPASSEAKKTKRKRKTRARRAPDAADEGGAETTAAGDEPAAPAVEDAGPEAPARKRRRRRSTKSAPEDAQEPVPAAEDAPDADRPVEPGDDVGADEPWAPEPAAEDEPEPEPGDADDDRERDDSDEDAERPSGRRRRRRRRRGGRGAEGGDDEPDRGPAPPPRSERRHRTGRMIPVPTPEGEIRGARVAVLLHLDPLIEDARRSGGEVAWGKLLQHVSRRRHLIRAIAYADPATAAAVGPTLRGSGIETHAVRTTSDRLVAVAVDAMALTARVDSVVLIPDSDGLGPLVAALRAHGIRVETAGFTDAGGPDDDIVQTRHDLGAESLFVP